MNDKQFKKGIDELKKIRMTDGEKSRMLKSVFSVPIESPYVKKISTFAFIYSHHAQMALAACLVVAISLGGVTYASDKALPGDILYSIKTGIVEPALDVVNQSPEKKIVWEEEKVERRIVEAEMLAENDELDDERSEELEKKIEKSSKAFVKAVDEVDGDDAENRKEEFRKKFESKDSDNNAESFAVSAMSAEVSEEESNADQKNNSIESERSRKIDNKSKVEKLRRAAVRAVDNNRD
ncbi:MAG: hypothetical protein WAX80_03720 [Minisyncoccia bacterium]